MPANFKEKKNIIYLVIFILSIVAALVLSDLVCFDCGHYYYENQFIDATVYGYLIMICLVFATLLLDEPIAKKTTYIILALGILLYLISAILIFIYFIDVRHYDRTWVKIRMLCGAAFCTAVGILYIFQLIFVLREKGDA